MRRVFVTGDSHTAALRRGQLALAAGDGWPADLDLEIQPLGGGHLTRDPFFVDRDDHAEITTVEYRRKLERLPLANDPGDVVYGLSAPLHSVRIWRHPGWQSFVPADLATAGTPVSSALVTRLALDDQRHVLDLLVLLKRLGRRVFVIEAPYPFRHHPALRKTAASTVRHLDRLYRRVMRRALSDLAVPIVSVPDQALDEGFMREQYAQAGDHHHGNERYGHLMMGEILAFLDRDGQEPTPPVTTQDGHPAGRTMSR